VPGLALVDQVDVAVLQPAEQHLLQRDVRAPPPEPRHLDVGGEAAAVRARQHRGVAERAQVGLLGHAPGEAVDPEPPGARGRVLGELGRALVEQRHGLRPAQRQPQAGSPRGPLRRQPPRRRGRRPAAEGGRLAPVVEGQPAGPPQLAELDQLDAAPQVVVGAERLGARPPHRVDLGQQEHPHHRGEVRRGAAWVGHEPSQVGQQRLAGRVRAGRRPGEHVEDLRLAEAPPQDGLGRRQPAAVGGDLRGQVRHRGPVRTDVRPGPARPGWRGRGRYPGSRRGTS